MKVFPTPQCISSPSFFSTFASIPSLIDWDAVYRILTQDLHLQNLTEKCRRALSEQDSATYGKLKKGAPAISPACSFVAERKLADIDRLTGIAMVDLDHIPAEHLLPIWQEVSNDPHTFLAYRTLSGSGIRVLYPYLSDKDVIAYVEAWRYGNQYYGLLTGCPYDESTKDASRLSFLAYDPECRYNPAAKPFVIFAQQTINDTMRSVEDNAFREDQGIMAYIDQAKNILDRQGCHFLPGNRHRYVLQLAFLLNKMGVAQEETQEEVDLLWQREDISRLKEGQDCVRYVYTAAAAEHGTWASKGSPRYRKGERKGERRSISRDSIASDRIKAQEGKPAAKEKCATIDEIRNFLIAGDRIRYNVITTCIEIYSNEQRCFVDVNDRVLNSLWCDANEAIGKYVRFQDFEKLLNSEHIHPFNAIDDFLSRIDGMPVDASPDGNPILKLSQMVHTSVDNISVDDNLTGMDGRRLRLFDACFAKWFVGMVASWVEERVTNQVILTLIGKQGMYKSTFFRRLLPPELNRYFLAKGNSSYLSKDDKLAVSNYALIDLEEIDALKDSDLNAIKALVTTEVISERAAYAKTRENRPHLASFCATGNNRQFLTDLTGNRRWLPFEITSIDNPYAWNFSYDELYAYALKLYKEDFMYWFDASDDAILEKVKDAFSEASLEEELILKYFRKPKEHESGYFLTTTDILARVSVDVRNQLSTKKVGMALAHLGYRRIWSKTSRRYGYILCENTFQEIDEMRIRDAVENKPLTTD